MGSAGIKEGGRLVLCTAALLFPPFAFTFPQSMLVPFRSFSFTFTFSSVFCSLGRGEMSLAWHSKLLLGPLSEQRDKSLLFGHCPA